MMDTILHWKRVWQTVSGVAEAVTEMDVGNALSAVKDDLVLGLSKFAPYSDESLETWKHAVRIDGDNTFQLEKIIERIARTINLDAQLTWQMFCNFLMFVYYGKVEDVQKLADVELQLKNFVEVFQHFYSMERMFCLKTLHYIINNFDNDACQYKKCYSMFIADVSILKIRASLINQLGQLQEELLAYRYSIKNQSVLIANEMTEVFLMLVASTTKWEVCSSPIGLFVNNLKQFIEQFGQLVELCGFQRYDILIDANSNIHSDIVKQNLNFARMTAILVPLVELSNFGRNLFDNDFLQWWDMQRKRLERLFMRRNCSDIFLLQWTLLQTTHLNDIELNTEFSKKEKNLNQVIKDALYLMTSICKSKFIERSAEGHQIRVSIYKILQQLYERIEVNHNFWYAINAIPLLAILLRDKDIALKWVTSTSSSEGLSKLLTISERRFPYDFKSFTTLIRAQLQHGEFQKQVLEKLTNLIYFTEATDIFPSEFETYKTIRNNFPMMEANIISESYNRNTVEYRTISYGYIDILQYIISYLLDAKMDSRYQSDEFIDPKHLIISEALKGLDLLLDVLDIDLHFASTQDMDNLLNQSFRMMAIYMPKNKYNHEIICRCLKLFVKMISNNMEKILYFLTLNGLLHVISIDESIGEDLLFFEMSIVDEALMRIMNNDSVNSMQNIIAFVIGMTQQCFKTTVEDHYGKVQLPLTIFLFQKVLPSFTMLIWRNVDYAKLTSIANILQLLQQIVQNEFGSQLFQSQCLKMFLTSENFVQTFFIIFGNSKGILERSVLFQSNWEKSDNPGVQVIKLCVNIILLLIQKTGGTHELLRQPFGIACIKTNTKDMNNLKIMAGLINNSLDTNLRIASCQLLTKFAQNSNIPMLAHLDMDSNQVRGMFLEKLRDPLESNSIKVAIIDLIAASIKAQYGLTLAFFNGSERKDRPMDLSDNLSSFTMEFLGNVEKSPEYLCTPLGESILNLILQLWKVNDDDANITNWLTGIKNFWIYLTQPLLAELKLPFDIYSKIITILYISLKRTTNECCRELTTNFDVIIYNMFGSRNEHLIVKLLRHVTRNQSPTHKELEFLVSLKSLLMVLVLKKPELFQQNEIKSDIAFHCLKGLQTHIKQSCDSHIITTWSGIYLYVITKWEHSCFSTTDFDVELCLLTDIINCFNKHYQSVLTSCQENLLTIACKIIQLLKKKNDPEPSITFKPFLDAMKNILAKEISLFAVIDMVSKNWIILITFVSHLLDLDWDSTYKTIFSNNNFIHYAFKTVCRSIKKRETLPIAKLAMEMIVKYARSSMYLDITVSVLELFYYNVNPPAEFLHLASHDFKTNRNWPFEAFWSIYADLMHLNCILLRRSSCRYLSSCFKFFSMHWLEIETLILLPSCTVELAALELVQSILDFGCELLQFRQQWQRNETSSISLIHFLEMVNRSVNSCIEIMVSPSILKFFSFSQLELLRVDDIPCNHFTEIMDRLVQIITISCHCYNKVSPSIITLMNPCELKREIPDVITIQCDFSIPRISKVIKNRLSYGCLLCLVQILCNSLHQLEVHASLFRQNIETTNISENDRGMSISPNATEHPVDNEISHHEYQKFENVLGFVCPNFVEDGDEEKKDINCYSAPWLSKLNIEYASSALEVLGTYLASQISLLLTNDINSTIECSYYRWSLSMELNSFQEYIMKRYRNLSNTGVTTQISHRGHPVHYIMAPKQHRNLDRKMVSSDSDDSGSECSNWGIAPDVNPIFPEAFIAWRDSQLSDNFIKPCFPEYEVVTEMISEEYYLLMISHWLYKICKLGH